MGMGQRILERERAVSSEATGRFAALPVANVSDCMARLFAGGARLRPMHDGTPMAGPAFTVKTRPGDNLFVHKALEMALPGDVIVVDAGGDLTNALIGEIMCVYAGLRGLAGFVINGAIRDADVLRKSSLPVFAAGVTHRGPYKNGLGEINVPVALDGMVVEPGDLVLGDADGVLCVPYDEVETVYMQASAKARNEALLLAAMRSGNYDSGWIDVAVAAAQKGF